VSGVGLVEKRWVFGIGNGNMEGRKKEMER
jgi:hypothetical protein